MHTHQINAQIQLLPIGTTEHPYYWVDKAIEKIQKSGLKYLVGPFGTSIEGSMADIQHLLFQLNEMLLADGCPEWLFNVQYHIKAHEPVKAGDKTRKFENAS